MFGRLQAAIFKVAKVSRLWILGFALLVCLPNLAAALAIQLVPANAKNKAVKPCWLCLEWRV